MLRRADDKLLILEADDHRIVRFQVSGSTKYKSEQKDIKTSDIKPGDHLLVESSEDDQGGYFALIVTKEKAGTEAERTAASASDEILTVPGAGPSGTPEDERPRLHRADSKADPKSDSKADSKPPKEANPLPAEVAEDNRPRTVVVPSGAPQGVDGEAPPRIKRGKPVARRSSSDDDTQEVASASLPPLPSAQSVPRPAAATDRTAEPQDTRQQEDPIIGKARGASESYTETLPNYIAQQMTTRYISTTPKPSWQAQDIVSAEVIYESGKERYRNVAVNNKPTKKSIEEVGGSWSTGEFASVLIDLFSRNTAAVFHSRGSDTINNRATSMFNFFVNQENSHWTIHGGSQSYRPAYKGSVWIDKETGRVLRIEMQTRNMPQDFPFDKVEMATDYDFVRLGTMQQYLLPVHSENLSCQRGSSNCSRNTIDFRNYKKFGSDSTIILKP